MKDAKKEGQNDIIYIRYYITPTIKSSMYIFRIKIVREKMSIICCRYIQCGKRKQKEECNTFCEVKKHVYLYVARLHTQGGIQHLKPTYINTQYQQTFILRLKKDKTNYFYNNMASSRPLFSIFVCNSGENHQPTSTS